MKTQYCAKCGCDRALMLKSPTIIDQNAEMEVGLKTVCLPCLLEMAKVNMNPELSGKLKLLYAIREDNR